MGTIICKPHTLTQTTTSDQVEWNLATSATNFDDGDRCGTKTPLTAVHGIGKLFDTQNTGILNWSGYRTPEILGVLTSISIRVYADKRARCLDNLIKLTVDGSAVGNNLASDTAGNDHTYSAAIPAGLTSTLHINRFGAQTQYRSGSLPHRDNMTVDTVHLIFTYS